MAAAGHHAALAPRRHAQRAGAGARLGVSPLQSGPARLRSTLSVQQDNLAAIAKRSVTMLGAVRGSLQTSAAQIKAHTK